MRNASTPVTNRTIARLPQKWKRTGSTRKRRRTFNMTTPRPPATWGDVEQASERVRRPEGADVESPWKDRAGLVQRGSGIGRSPLDQMDSGPLPTPPRPTHRKTVKPSGLRSPLGLGCSSELKCLGPESNQRHGDFQAAFRNGQGREIPAEDGPRGGPL